MDTPEITAIKIEKRLCGALMRQWTPGGMSVETLAEDASNEIEKLRRKSRQYYQMGRDGIIRPIRGEECLSHERVEAACITFNECHGRPFQEQMRAALEAALSTPNK